VVGRRPLPHESSTRCAVKADLRHDPMRGTAFPAARLLLVEQPGPWGRAGLRESDFDPVVAADLEDRAHQSGLRVIAIRRPGRTSPSIARRWVVVDTRDGHQGVSWGEYAADADLLELALDGSSGRPDPAATYLVCAHSKHDICCAVRGRPVAGALAELRPGQVWECSHIGGERFAANVLVVPSGLMYGRVQPWLVEQLVAAVDADEVVAPLLRGRIGFAPVAQAALAFAYERLGLRRRDAVRVVGASKIADTRATVRLAAPDGELDVLVQVDRVTAEQLTCADPREGHFLAYRPLRIDPARP
jgi:hypothetical protein